MQTKTAEGLAWCLGSVIQARGRAVVPRWEKMNLVRVRTKDEAFSLVIQSEDYRSKNA